MIYRCRFDRCRKGCGREKQHGNAVGPARDRQADFADSRARQCRQVGAKTIDRFAW